MVEPPRRCHAVAEPIGAYFYLDLAVTYDARLVERDFGDWEGMRWSSIDRKELDRWAAAPTSFRPPNGESGEALVERVRAFHRNIEERGENALVIAHGGPLRVLEALLRRDAIDLLRRRPWAQSKWSGFLSRSQISWRNPRDNAAPKTSGARKKTIP
jgi:alpha-ribazole phosphatase